VCNSSTFVVVLEYLLPRALPRTVLLPWCTSPQFLEALPEILNEFVLPTDHIDDSVIKTIAAALTDPGRQDVTVGETTEMMFGDGRFRVLFTNFGDDVDHVLLVSNDCYEDVFQPCKFTGTFPTSEDFESEVEYELAVKRSNLLPLKKPAYFAMNRIQTAGRRSREKVEKMIVQVSDKVQDCITLARLR
jgi:hypothetical protein